MSIVKRIISLVMCVVLLIPLSTNMCDYDVFATQSRKGNFSQNFTLTGNGADDIVAVARAQLGKTGSQLGYSEQWCADFVSDCADLAGQSVAVPRDGYCPNLRTKIVNAGGIYVSTYTAQKGDIVFYGNNGAEHVEIVYAASNGVVSTIGGNSGSSKSLLYRAVKDHSTQTKPIAYIVRPNYKTTSQTPTLDQGTLVNLGDSFSARIRNCSSGKLLTNANNSNVYLDSTKSENFAKQIWKFTRNSDGSYKIISSVTNVAMDLDCAKDEDRANIKLNGNYDTKAQNYYILQRTDGTLMIKPVLSQSRVFDIEYGSTDDGTNISIYSINDSDAQKFYIDKCSNVGNFGNDFSALIINKNCWKPITVGYNNKVFLETETILKQPKQMWHFTYNSDDGTYFIKSYYNDCYLDVSGGSNTDGTPIGVWKDNKDLAQRWFLVDRGDGYVLKAACTSKVMDLTNGSENDGTAIQIWPANGSNAQVFDIYKINGERDKISYNLMTESANVAVGETTTISIENARYAIDYKLHIVSPSGEKETVELGQSNVYKFIGKEQGIYKIYAEVKSPVSSYIGSETDKCISIAVGYDFNKSEKLNTVYKGHLYQLIEKKNVDWTQAKNYCESNNGYLTSVTSEGENNAVANLVKEYNGYAFLGGIRKSDTEFRWVQASGDDFGYTNWKEGEPNYANHVTCPIKDTYGTYARENYIAMIPSGQWNDVTVFDENVNAFVMESNVESIEIKDINKISYKEGEKFDKDSLKVEATFADGTKKNVTDYAVEGFDSTKNGEQKVTISYYGITQSFFVNVEHNYISKITVEPKCDVAGVRKYECDVCGEAYTETIPALGHKFTEKVVKPTAEENGYTLHICTVCQYSYKDNYTNPTGHDYVLMESKEAGCLIDGYKKYKCNDCYKEYTETLLATGHKYTDEIVEPTCTESGYTLHKCSKCGESYKDAYVNAKSHSYVSKLTTEPTCTTDGLMTYTCKNCNEKKTETVPALGHNYVVSVIEHTCENQGYTLHKCAKCGVSYKDNYTEEADHSYVSNIIKQATCQSTGTREYTCKICNTSYTETIPRTEHNYVENVTRYPTCTNDGLAEYICGVCGDSYTQSIKKIDHEFVQKVVEPTCGTIGYVADECIMCGFEKVIKQKNATNLHIYHVEKVVLPTLTSEGYTLKVCDVCGSEIKTNIVPKLKGNPAAKNVTINKVKKLKLNAGKKKVTVSWKKVSKVSGYQIQYSTNSKMTKAKRVVVKKNKTKVVIKRLKSKKVLYVRIRAYKKVKNKTFYSKWSSMKKTKIK